MHVKDEVLKRLKEIQDEIHGIVYPEGGAGWLYLKHDTKKAFDELQDSISKTMRSIRDMKLD